MLSIYLSVLDSDEDKSRFEVLYNLYRQSMYAIAYGILHNEFDAEDAVHESFLKIANHFEKIEEIKCPKTKAFIVIIFITEIKKLLKILFLLMICVTG